MSLPSNAGSCMTCSACGNYTNFYKNSTKTFDVTQYLQDTNSIYVYFHNFTGGYSYKISNLEFTIKTYSKLQFTDTIRANFDNFNSKLSIPINIKNYDDINISNVENYYCNGNSLTFQPHIYNYKIAYWRVVKSIEIEISGQADDYAQVIVNNSITVHPNLQDTLGIKDGIYIWGKTQSSDYVKEKHPFTMTNENLNIQFGTVNTLPTVCFLKASLKIRLFFQFTSTVKLSSNSSYATINKDIPVGYFFTNLGDDNSDALRGTWNADRTVKTVTSSTADWSDYLISGADIVFLNSDIHDGLTCLKFSDGRNVNIPQNFEVTIDKMIPFYEYHQGNDDPSFPTHRKDGYYFYLTISPIWFTSFSNANILLSNRNNMNGSYNFTFKFNYNNKDYSFKKTLVISF